MNNNPTWASRLRAAALSAVAVAALAAAWASVAIAPAPALQSPGGHQEQTARPLYVSLAAHAPDFNREATTSTSGRTADPAPAAPRFLTLGQPLPGAQITSTYHHRTSPISGQAEFHNGQDYAGACGTPVSSSEAGTVTFAGVHNGTGGNRVEVLHANGISSTYSHLSAISVATGQQMQQGQSVGAVGSTGASTGCHLHFEVWKDGVAVDPQGWL